MYQNIFLDELKKIINVIIKNTCLPEYPRPAPFSIILDKTNSNTKAIKEKNTFT